MHAVPDIHPVDEYNQTLVQNVHPPDWQNPEPAPRYNLVVIGAGTAGLGTAAGARAGAWGAGISHHDAARRFRELGVDVFLGEARFIGPRTLEVNGKTL